MTSATINVPTVTLATSMSAGTSQVNRMAASSRRIDAHHHIWRYCRDEFDWITENMSSIRRDFLLTEFVSEMAAAGIDGGIAVQARGSLAETEFLLASAMESEGIFGVVGWAPISSPRVGETLDRLCANSLFIGVREIVQGRPLGFLDDGAFNRGIRELTVRNLTYDILISSDQLGQAIQLVDRHPDQRFILDHAAKPCIAKGQLEPWLTNLRSLGLRPNVSCKLSGLVTEADWQSWKPAELAPFIDSCVEVFSPARLIAGSDWPVCLVASGYGRWWQTLRDYFSPFTTDEQAAVFGLNADRIYQIPCRATV